ncbi:MAG TPA: hypothetical protein ENJ15_02505 [Caldithrix abyssi]|uniref:Basal-body rod modification protein FlgD n=1 Tax=Caldithrix abyssi TaxID=187145 RepID=A0A7V5VEW4_CALAY|nr:hypothetical protein [Caldithrix abyssi]
MDTGSINTAATGTSALSDTRVFQNSLGKEEFLKLLVVQLQNQDPLSPLESQEFSAQLAQFSSVEQLTNIDNNLEESIKSNVVLSQTINNTLATTLIGKQVTAAGNQVELAEGTPAKVSFELQNAAQEVTVTITDSAGNVVRTLEGQGLSSGIQSLEWDGRDDDGIAVPEGIYSFSVKATDASGAEVVSQPLIRGVAGSLLYSGGAAYLRIGALNVSFGDVLEISGGLGG